MKVLLSLLLSAGLIGSQQTVTQVFDATSADSGVFVVTPIDVALDSADNLYVLCRDSDNVFRVALDGTVTLILDASGDGMGNPLDGPVGVVVDATDNVFVSSIYSDRVFRVTPSGIVSVVLGPAGDGINPLDAPENMLVDDSGNLFVAGRLSDNVLRVSPTGQVTQVLDGSGDGMHDLEEAKGLAMDDSGNLYVGGLASANVFRVTPGGVVEQVMDSAGNGVVPLLGVWDLVTDAHQNVYVSAIPGAELFRIAPTGDIDVSISFTASDGSLLVTPLGLAVDATRTVVFVSSFVGDNVIALGQDGRSAAVIDASGDGMGAGLQNPNGLAIDSQGNLYVAAQVSTNVLKVTGPFLPASSVPRNGSGVNSLTLFEVQSCAIGGTWECAVELAPSDTLTILALSKTSLSGVVTGAGEMLVGFPLLFWKTTVGNHVVAIPNDCSLVGIALFAQGASIGASGYALTNALDIIVGSF